MFASKLKRTFYALHTAAQSNPRTRKMLIGVVAITSGFFIAASYCMAQDTAGGGARNRRSMGSSVRIEATSFIQWNKAAFDPSRGSATFWLHISAASGGGTTGGFTIDAHPRILGKITSIHVNKAPSGQKASSRPSPLGAPTTVRLIGGCSYGGKDYEVQFDVVGDQWKPSPVPGGRGSSVKGSIHVKLIDARTKAITEAMGVRQSSVTIWQK